MKNAGDLAKLLIVVAAVGLVLAARTPGGAFAAPDVVTHFFNGFRGTLATLQMRG